MKTKEIKQELIRIHNTCLMNDYSDEQRQDYVVNFIEQYATQRESKWKELYEAQKKLDMGCFCDECKPIRQKISALESELNLNTK